jgi:Asp-tRNA(Asn)/Glu-tRNA(Gln) amidotransferase C subunit
MSRYTSKQIEKFQRQKYITFLEKIFKNLFRLLRNEETTAEKFSAKLQELMIKFEKLEKPRMDSEYMQQAHEYVERLYRDVSSDGFDDERYADICEAEMSNLNRLQKLKNKGNYKKDKHRHGERDQDWG